LATHAEAGDWRQMRRTLLQSLGAAIALALPAVAALVLLGRPTIRILFEHGQFDAAAGDLTYNVLIAYAVALPAYVATEVITRGLIALRDTRTPLLTNTAQLIGRAVIISLLLSRFGVVAIPVAFAVTASLETLTLGTMLLLRLQRRISLKETS
jgi:putative peptidoglycan lipid II flippase